MKHLKALLFLAALTFGLTLNAKADLGVSVFFGGGHRHSGYERRHVRYYDEPIYRSYRPRRVVRYYEEPVYYAPRRHYYRPSRAYRCD